MKALSFLGQEVSAMVGSSGDKVCVVVGSLFAVV